MQLIKKTEVRSKNSNRIRVICTRPSGRPPRLIICLDNRHHRAVCPSNGKEPSTNNDENTPTYHQYPSGSRIGSPRGPVVVEPHAAHWLEHHHTAQEGADERDEGVEDWDSAGNYVCDNGNGEYGTEPGEPVDESVGC